MLSVADMVLQGFRWSAAPGDVTASLLLAPRRERALERRAADPSAPALTAAQIGRRFGPTDAAVRRVRRAVRAAGLRPAGLLPQRSTLRVSGPAAAVERAFGTRLVHVRPGVHRPLIQPRVPAALRRDVLAVTGLDTRPLAKPAAFPAGGLRPVDARRAYNMGTGLLGEGEAIAVLSLDSFHDEDVAMYDRIVGIDSGPVERVPVNGGTRVGTDSEEVNLDLDVIRGLVPRAQLLNYETPNRAGAFADVMERIVADGRARIVSISWGRCELTVPEAERARDDAAFRAAAAAGITVFVASGDSGAYECERFDRDDQRLSVSWPAASRYVIAVGGTTLRLDADRERLEEAGWESVLSNAGAGGGVAGSEPQPAWQRTSTLPGLRNEHSTGRRQVPDVAAAADFRTGWFAVVDGEERHFGGTSAAAPFWAAVAATLRESLRRENLPFPRSFGNFIYVLAQRPGSRAFHDITVGGNRFFDAAPGWDYVTGLGTPDVERLVAEARRLQRGEER
jgi:kumamolisin